MRISRRTAAIAATVSSLALVLGLAGPASAAPPVPSINIDCTKLASATNPFAAFSTPVTQRYAAVSELTVNPILPSAEVIRTAGGLACEWTNGLYLDGGWTAAPVGVRVEYLPYAASGYWRWAAVFGGTTTSPESFFCGTSYCQLATSEGGDFLIVGIQNARSVAIAESLARRISTALQLGATTPFVAPHYAAELDHTCEQIVRPVAWRSAVNALAVPRTFPIPPGWGPVNNAMLVARAPACAYTDATGVHGVGLLSTMPGGRWSFILLSSLLTAPGPLTAIRVPGMRAGDTAFTRCDAAHEHCILDALIATHWVQVNLLSRADGGDLIRADRLAALRPILSEIALQIYTP
jgi:hypothetical protein